MMIVHRSNWGAAARNRYKQRNKVHSEGWKWDLDLIEHTLTFMDDDDDDDLLVWNSTSPVRFLSILIDFDRRRKERELSSRLLKIVTSSNQSISFN